MKERSGVGQYVFHLLDSLGKGNQGHEYLLFYVSVRQQLNSLPVSCRNVSVKRVLYPRRLLHLATGLGRWDLPGFDRLIGSVDVCHWPNYILLPGGTARQIITICDLTFLLFPAYHPWARVKALAGGIARSASRADAIIVVSEHTKRDVIKYLGVPEEKIRVVYCAASSHFRFIASEARRSVLSKYHLPLDGYLLYVGNIEPRKNLTRLLEAYSLLKARGGCRLPLIFSGGGGWKNTDIYRRVSELSLEKDVRFLGYVPDEELPALMSGAELFVYPSLYEGFGLPPLEAMACGTPVVTSNVSSIPEVVGDAALMVDPYDVEGLAEAMQRALMDKDLREDMRIKGLARAKLFSWERTACETLKVYEEVHAKGRLG
ncbi:MAG: glycosyltransferase family 1 protein [Nitrospiraceae bacterium]